MQESIGAYSLAVLAGVVPNPTFKKQIEYYYCEPSVRAAVDELDQSSVGHGGYISVEKGFDDILSIAQDFIEEIELETHLCHLWGRELWCTGNTISEMVDPPPYCQKVVNVPINTIERVFPRPDGSIYKYIQVVGALRHELVQIDHYRHWKWNPIGSPITGHGLVECLLLDGLGYTYQTGAGSDHWAKRPSYQQCLEEMEDAMRISIRKFAPKNVYTLLGVDVTERDAIAAQLQTLMPSDDVVVHLKNKDKMDLKVQTLQSNSRQRADPTLKYFSDARVSALQTPTLLLFLEAGFTQASAKVAVAVLNRKIESFQKFVGRGIVRDFLRPIVIQELTTRSANKMNLANAQERLKKSKITWTWRPTDQMQLQFSDYLSALQIQAQTNFPIFTAQEIRDIFIEFGAPLSHSTPPNPEPQPQSEQITAGKESAPVAKDKKPITEMPAEI